MAARATTISLQEAMMKGEYPLMDRLWCEGQRKSEMLGEQYRSWCSQRVRYEGDAHAQGKGVVESPTGCHCWCRLLNNIIMHVLMLSCESSRSF